jgi:hypothetical protein
LSKITLPLDLGRPHVLDSEDVRSRYVGKYRDQKNEIRTAPDGPYSHKAAAERAAAAESESRSLGWRDPKAASRSWCEWRE